MWCFEEINPKAVKRDPFEGEFFRGEGVSDRIKGHSEALVREVVQNAIDASLPAAIGTSTSPVQLRFVLKTEACGLPSDKASCYFSELEPHLSALGLDAEIQDINTGTVPFMLIEDFQTIGLTGDVERKTDPGANISAAYPECFYWFWRNVGRSGKTSEQLGRWGLGKTVIPASSRINTFFGITRRADDSRTLFMGQSILKLHSVDGKEYLPEGFFCNPERTDLQIPFEDSATIDRFCDDFGIDRSSKTGLSVVVPLPLAELTAVDLTKALVANFFVRVLRNEIAVTVQQDNQPPIEINVNTLDEVAAGIDWENAESGRQTPPPLEFVRTALNRKAIKSTIALQKPADGGAPHWTENLFPVPAERFGYYTSLQNNEIVCATVPLNLEMKDGSLVDTSFFLAIQKVREGAKSWEGYVRNGMRITKVSTGFVKTQYNGIVLVDDNVLSDFLGDAEGPAHLDWAESEKRPDKRYKTWVSRLRFVKKALKSFIDVITPPPEELDYNIYAGLFQDLTPGPMDEGKNIKKKKTGITPPLPPLPPPRPKPFILSMIEGGFHVRWNSEFTATVPIAKIQAFYESTGSRKWSPFDFEFGAEGSPISVIESENAEAVVWEKNVITIKNPRPGFTIKVTGFKNDTDLTVRTAP